MHFLLIQMAGFEPDCGRIFEIIHSWVYLAVFVDWAQRRGINAAPFPGILLAACRKGVAVRNRRNPRLSDGVVGSNARPCGECLAQ
jgi:hypothetical protein